MKHVILFHKDCTKFLIKHGMDATWLPHSAPSDSTVKGQVRLGRVWNGIALRTRQGPSSLIFTYLTYSQVYKEPGGSGLRLCSLV